MLGKTAGKNVRVELVAVGEGIRMEWSHLVLGGRLTVAGGKALRKLD